MQTAIYSNVNWYYVHEAKITLLVADHNKLYTKRLYSMKKLPQVSNILIVQTYSL